MTPVAKDAPLALVAPPAADVRPTARKTPYMLCGIRCECGKRVGAMMAHYDHVACSKCGKDYWALEPNRDKGLVLFPHPGFGDYAGQVRFTNVL